MAFRGHGRLDSVRFLRGVRLQPSLLRAALDFWDPDLHVFRFGLDELCPTVEDFQAYLRGYDSAAPVVPELQKSFPPILVSKLGISGGTAGNLVKGNRLNIPRLVELFGGSGDRDDLEWQDRRCFALVICVLAGYFLVSSDGVVSPRLIGVAAQLGQRRDPAPLILAETLLGLDRMRRGETEVLGGSPILLQVFHSFPHDFGFSISLRPYVEFLTCFSTRAFYGISYLFFHSNSSGYAIG
jgi:hypothetical protein